LNTTHCMARFAHYIMPRMQIRCPICSRVAPWEENPNRPFCSEKCQLIDLGHWASGNYSIPGEAIRSTEEEAEIKDGENRNGQES
jgi:uncharacterized protein